MSQVSRAQICKYRSVNLDGLKIAHKSILKIPLDLKMKNFWDKNSEKNGKINFNQLSIRF